MTRSPLLLTFVLAGCVTGAALRQRADAVSQDVKLEIWQALAGRNDDLSIRQELLIAHTLLEALHQTCDTALYAHQEKRIGRLQQRNFQSQPRSVAPVSGRLDPVRRGP